MSAFGGGDSLSNNVELVVWQLKVSLLVFNVTNNCDEDLITALFDYLFRFRLDENKPIFIARTVRISFGACDRAT